MLEGGTRVPLIASWKGTTPPGKVLKDMVDFSDFYATFAELAGAKQPANLTFDGRSFAPQLRGQKGNPREWIYVQLGRNWYVKEQGWKLNQSGELYDMKDAPFVEKLVPAGTEDANAAAGRKRLQAVLDEAESRRWQDRTGGVWRGQGWKERGQRGAEEEGRVKLGRPEGIVTHASLRRRMVSYGTPMTDITLDSILDSHDPSLYQVRSKAPGPAGRLPFTPEMLAERPSGDLFGWSMNAGMGWEPAALGGDEYLILSTHGGLRAPDGTPIALGYHTGHWEVGLLMQAAAEELKSRGAIPFAGYCTDPCDGRTQGTPGMFDSLPYRNDAATIFRRLIRSLPTRRGVLGVATCDKGLPAMMMTLASMPDLPCVLVPGGVTLRAEDGEDTAVIQSLGARYVHGEITLDYAAEVGCRACASPGGGCQFMGTAATSQVVGEALGMSLTHSALAPSGHPIWIDMARRSARALLHLERRGIHMRDLITEASIHNAMVAHAAVGGSMNLVLHLPAIAHAAGLPRPTVEDWARVNRKVPRIVDVLPNGPRNHPTVQVFLAGGVPEMMLHLKRAGLLELGALTVSGETLGKMLEWWESSHRATSIPIRDCRHELLCCGTLRALPRRRSTPC